MTFRAFGDSIMSGAVASIPANGYVSRVSAALGVLINNLSVPGHMAMDMEASFYAQSFECGDTTLIGFGANDQAMYLLDANKRNCYVDAMRAYAVLASAETKLATPANAVAFSGTWSNSYSYGTYASATAGSKAVFGSQGPNLAVGFIRQTGNTSTFRVKVDGASNGVYSSGGDVTTRKGKSYGPMCLLFRGLGEGLHVVEIEIVNGDGYWPTYFRFFSSCEQKATACVMSVSRAIAYTGGGSDSNVAQYNAGLSAMVADLQATGLKVLMADVTSLLKLPDDMYDDVHWNDWGHLKAAAAVLGQLQDPQLSFRLASVFADAFGGFYTMAPSGLKKIQFM